MYIDGENVAATKAGQIMEIACRKGTLDFAKVYGLQKDKATKNWTEFALGNNRVRDIRLYGGPAKDKVDRKIRKDTLNDVKKSKNIDIVVLVSSDHGYVETMRKLRESGKHIVVIGEKKTPDALRRVCNEFVQI